VSKLKGASKINPNILGDYLASRLDKGMFNIIPPGSTHIKVHKMSRIRGGKHDTYAFFVHFLHEGKSRILKLILKLYKEEKIAEREYLTIKALEHVNFPVPHAYALETERNVLGAPFVITEKVEGKTAQDHVKHLSEDERLKLIEHFAETLVSLHDLKIDELDLKFLQYPKDEHDYAKKQTLKEEGEWAIKLLINQNFEWAIEWLEENAHRCPCSRWSLLHGDMNPKNFIVTKSGRIFFLDWTWADIGDALKDVGYAYHNIRHMFGIRNIDKRGAKMAAHFLERYIGKSSRNIDHFTLAFYLFSAGLREALYFGSLSKELKHPLRVGRIFGIKFLAVFPFVYWHFEHRYKDLRRFLERMVFDRARTLDYEQKMFGTPGGKIQSSIEMKEILGFLKPESSELILDIGTGSGRVAREILSNAKAKVIGIDVGRSTIESAKVHARNLSGYEMVVADGQYLPFKEDSFDGIICIRALKYFPDYVLGISEMSRVLKSGKRLVVDLSSVLGYEIILRYITDCLAARGSHVFNLYKMRDLLRSHRLAIVDSASLQKIPHKMWTLSRNSTVLNLLMAAEDTLRKTTPLMLSRSVLLECIKEK
jgi:aminoglycoside phosphotransferase (APT) family kinase protein/SAM-dependent methyltransferase